MTNTELIRQAIERNTELINSISCDVYSEFQCGQMHSYGSLLAFIEKLPKEEEKPVVYVPKFRVGDKVLSTNNPHLTYDILEVGLINELGNPDYRVEILTDEQSDTPHNIRLIECQKMDKWGKLIEQKPAEWSEDDEKMLAVISYKISQRQGNDERSLFTPDEAEFIGEMEDRLKSLRPQPRWKPGKEQMDALEYFVQKHKAEANAATGIWPDYEMLVSLRNDLKKL